jgi:hypothetical protein
MYDKEKIIPGLLIFIALATFPIWYGLVSAGDAPKPELREDLKGTKCIEDTAYMRANHMQLLMDWRDEVVREGSPRTFKDAGGAVRQKSLTLECLSCHSNKDKFCDECHEYLKVKPYCWDCHVIPIVASTEVK